MFHWSVRGSADPEIMWFLDEMGRRLVSKDFGGLLMKQKENLSTEGREIDIRRADVDEIPRI
jgi:hypothetical protein